MLLFTTQDMSSYIRSDRMEGITLDIKVLELSSKSKNGSTKGFLKSKK